MLKLRALHAVTGRHLAAHRAEGGLHRLLRAGQHIAAAQRLADADGRRVFENRLHNGLLLRLAAQHRQQRAGAVFLHHNGGREDLHRARLANLLHRKANRLGGHIVDVAVQLVNGVRAVAGFAQHRAHTVRRFKVLLAHAVTHALHAHLCFYGGTLPADIPAEYRAYIEDMQASFALLDERIAEINSMTEDGESLDAIRVKAFFYALYFGAESPSSRAHQQFVDCFVTYEERTRPLDSTDSEDESAGEPEEETYTVAIPITDIATIWSNIQTALGETVTEEQRNNVDSIYNLVRYGSATGTEGWIPGAEVPFIGADGFCSPVGSSWESRVTSEFGYRSDPFTGQTKGHTGIDIAVPTGTPVRAALPGVVTKATYNAGGYGYYVMIDHGNGMVTLYAHNSKLLVSVGDTVEAGDTVSLSGSTGRSTGPHLHFEVRVNGQRVNPRSYLPTN